MQVTSKKTRHVYATPSFEEAQPSPVIKHPLDSEDNERLLYRLQGWLQKERDVQLDNRIEMAIDRDYYDNIQWTIEEIKILMDRGQRAAVINQVAPAVDWVLGTEKKLKVDWRILPRSPEDNDGSNALSKLTKYVSDTNKAPHIRSKAFEDAVISGIGWIEVFATSNDEKDPIQVKVESWRNIYVDSASRENDLSDARYLFRIKSLDVDIAKMLIPDRADVIELHKHEIDAVDAEQYEEGIDMPSSGLSTNAAFDTARSVVRLVEAWFKVPEKVSVIRGGRLNGTVYDANDPVHTDSIQRGASLRDSVRMCVYCAIFVDKGGLLYVAKSPYAHERFPFVPVFGKKRGRDNQTYGIVRAMRDPQDGLNKRRSKADWLLASNRIIMDKGAVDDEEEARSEAARPDMLIALNANKRFDIVDNVQLADAHVQIENSDAAYIRTVSGVTGENLGLNTNAVSGKAILARQDQGNTVLTGYFDNLRYAWQVAGEMILSLIKQVYTQEQIIRIGIDPKTNNPEWLAINQWDEQNATYLNDISNTMADFIVSEQDYRDTMRQAMYEQMMEMAGKLPPDVALKLLDIILEFADLPDKEAIKERLQAIINPPQPPIDPLTQAKLQESIANAQLKQANAQQVKISALTNAITGAQQLATTPQLAGVVDNMTQQLDQILFPNQPDTQPPTQEVQP